MNCHKLRGSTPSPVIARLFTISALTLMACLAGPAVADEDTIAKGQALWKGKADCMQCHGWAADGKGGFHHEGQALSLRVTELSRDQIRVTIQCGRPGTPMPHFDRFAYSDKRCYGMTAEDLGDQLPNNSPTALQPFEIDALADYIAAKIKGAGPATRSECLAFYAGSSGAQCDTYHDK